MSVDVRKSSKVFLSFLVSKPGSLWRMKVQQQPCGDYHENDVGEEEESFEDLLKVCGMSGSKSNSRHPRSTGFSLKRFIKNEIQKRKNKLVTLPQKSRSRSLQKVADVKFGSWRKPKLLFGK